MERYIGLWIGEINRDVENDGLTANAIRKEIEEILAKEGIRLLTKQESSVNSEWQKQGEANLRIYPRILKNLENRYVFRINIEFEQNAQPMHYHDMDSLFAAWAIMCGGKSSDVNDIRRIVKDGIKLFLSFYTFLNSEA